MKNLIFLFLQLTIVFNCEAQEYFNYNLNKPILHHKLPAILNEVSGLTDIDTAHVACVQDELGTVFIYNFRTGNIVSRHTFDGAGDFEGLTYTGKELYILRSDGRLTEWNGFPTNPSANNKNYQLSLLTSNNEGLCYDKKHNRMLIAAKSKPETKEAKSLRYIYAFDLKRKVLVKEPVYIVNTVKISLKARELKIHNNATTPKGKERPFNFRPSSLAVHPLSDNIYIISATDKLLLIMNRKGEILHIEKLNPETFLKAEGITFLADGTMIITNEAAGKTPDLLVFEMQK